MDNLFQAHARDIVVRNAKMWRKHMLKYEVERAAKLAELHEITNSTFGSKLIVDIDFETVKSKNMDFHMYRAIGLLLFNISIELRKLDKSIYVEDEDFVVLNGSRQKKNAYKYSFHIVLPGYYFKKLPDLLAFITPVFAAVRTDLHPKLRDIFDTNPYTRDETKTSSMRLPYSFKTDDPNSRLLPMMTMPRIQICNFDIHGDGHIPEFEILEFKTREFSDMLLSYNVDCMPICVDSGAVVSQVVSVPLPDKLIPILKSYIDDGLELTNTNELKRVSTGFCKVCCRTHDKISSYFVYTGGCIWLKCFRNRKQSKLVYGKPDFETDSELVRYDQFTTPNIKTFDNKFCQEFPNVKTLCVRSPMGSGKTFQMRRMLENIYDFEQGSVKHHKTGRVLMLSFRKSFTQEMSKNLGFANYLEVQNLREQDRLIIQVDSLYKICGCKYDLLICDEIESIMEQLNSNQIKRRAMCFSVFQNLVMTTPRLLALDANLGTRSDWLMRLREKNYFLMINTYKSFSGQTMIDVMYLDRLYEIIHESLLKNESIAFITNSYSHQEKIQAYIESNFPHFKDSLFINGKSDPELKKRIAENPNEEMAVSFLSFTPTITAGCNFDIEHFDRIFGVFTDQSTSVLTSRQMLRRIRKIRHNEIYIHFDTIRESKLPEEIDEIETYIGELYKQNHLHDIYEQFGNKEVSFKEDGTVIFPYRDFGFNLSLLNIQEHHKDMNRFRKRFLEQERITGMTIKRDKSKPNTIVKMFKQVAREHLTKLKKDEAADICRQATSNPVGSEAAFITKSIIEDCLLEGSLEPDQINFIRLERYREIFKSEPTVERLLNIFNSNGIFQWRNRSLLRQVGADRYISSVRVLLKNTQEIDGSVITELDKFPAYKAGFGMTAAFNIIDPTDMNGKVISKELMLQQIDMLKKTIPNLNEFQIACGTNISNWGDHKRDLEIINAILKKSWGYTIVKQNRRDPETDYITKTKTDMPEYVDIVEPRVMNEADEINII